jgi:putative membrane protein
MPISEKEQQQINAVVARFEASTGVQAVAAIARKADSYPEIPWKAYAIASALAALAVAVFTPFSRTGWNANALGLNAMLIIGAGAVLAIAAALAPFAGRLFLDRHRAELEARQHAKTLFLERELFRTRDRRAVLVLLLRFERLAVVMPDAGLAGLLSAAELLALSESAGALLSRRGAVAAFEHAFGRLELLLSSHGVQPSRGGANELPDEIIVEKGA